MHKKCWTMRSTKIFKLIACYEEFQKHFPAEVVDHYDDVYQVGRKAVEF
jgi:hypothetical protein